MPEGTYFLKNQATGFVLDSNADKNVYTGDLNGGAFQHWQVEDAGNGFSVLKNQATGFVLDSNADKNVYTGDLNGGAFQHWQVEDAGNGFSVLKNQATSFVLDSNADKNVYTGDLNGGAFQQWQLEPVVSAGPADGMIGEILAAHNKYRGEVGVPPLTWSGTLAQSAQQWASQLAATHQLAHSGAGENLFAGTTGAYSFTQMVDAWGNEKEHFISGRAFPDVSTTGNWEDVGHYTQVVWRNTTEVGCGIMSDGQNDFLVGHYNPPGNIIGQSVY